MKKIAIYSLSIFEYRYSTVTASVALGFLSDYSTKSSAIGCCSCSLYFRLEQPLLDHDFEHFYRFPNKTSQPDPFCSGVRSMGKATNETTTNRHSTILIPHTTFTRVVLILTHGFSINFI